ncbi:MAG: ATP-binding protein [Clostridiales bacterium]|nr:ATP-binding protein [Clostridiales bacterium]
MAKRFNVNGACDPNRHYMVNLNERLQKIRNMVDDGEYFAINRARQYGKTTTLQALTRFLRSEYEVISLDFQRLGSASYENEAAFASAFANELLRRGSDFPEGIRDKLHIITKRDGNANSLQSLFAVLDLWCKEAVQPIVLIIDEVDSASNNQVFLDFLAQLRASYLERPEIAAFQSVILAGVYDIRSIKRKIRPDEAHKVNSPWNIAADFDIDMSFSVKDIANMIDQYENDYHTGMDIQEVSQLIYNYTSGYPVLVSRICKLLDEKIAGSDVFPDRKSAWTKEGFYEAEKRIVREDNPLYESLMGKLETYPELRTVIYELLFNGKSIPYVATSPYIKDAAMFGFIRCENDRAVISNRIFEAVLYNNFIAEEFITSKMYDAGERERNYFFVGGHLDIRRILEKFIETFEELYSQEDERFLENVGRKYFLLFLKPIINGVGNYSIEPQTRNSERMDLVIYYKGEQNILELKLWRGNAYNQRGEAQLSGYLDYFHLKKGYMLSFCFNKNKKPGIQEIVLGDKLLIEAVV